MVPFFLLFCFLGCQTNVAVAVSISARQTSSTVSSQDELFLEDLERRSFDYFWEQGDLQTGLVPDRARMDGSALDEDHLNVASIAATGFGLTALCIAAERRWIGREHAKERVRNTLRFFATRAFHKNGWFYHWLDAKTQTASIPAGFMNRKAI